jgi:hypothetical protein
MLTNHKFGVTAAFAVLFAASSMVRAQDTAVLQKELESKYSLTTINAEGGVVTQGVTLTLKKPGFIGGAKSCTLDYKGGALALSGSSKTTCTIGKASAGMLGSALKNKFSVLGGAPDAQATRPFVAGEKLWVTKIAIDKDVVSFTFVSDTIKDVIYYGVIRFQPQPGATPDAVHVDQTFTEVFSVAAPDTKSDAAQQPAAPAPAAGPAPAPQQAASPALAPIAPPPPPPDPSGPTLAPIAPPPPPPDQPVQTVSMGMTEDQVVSIMGQPTTKADLGAKKIYSYKSPGLKVIFVEGKVSDIQ